jgi:hypothetical protein
LAFVKVIGAGLPRTGTLTQKIALEMLGLGPCYHMVNVLTDSSLIEVWADALAGHADWDKVFDGFNATVDYPGAFFYKELVAAYPDAKVLLSVRDSRAWARSMHDTIWGVLYDHGSMAHHLAAAQGFIDPAMHAYTELMTDMLNRAGLFGPAPARFVEDALVAGIEQHNAEVRAAVPAGQLLEWSPADGWGPLCEFLERPAPAAPLPRVNDSSSFNAMISASAMQKLTAWWSRQPDPTLPGPAPAIP